MTVAGYIHEGLVFPKPKLVTESLIRRALRHFPPLAGRLATTLHEDDETISFFIDCNDAGALFIHAAADGVTVSDIIMPAYVPSVVHSCFALNGLYNYKGIANPLLGIQVTDLADGIFIGCSINHVVADGTSFWHFLNSWSEISNGSINLSKSPVFQRWFPVGMEIPIPLLSHIWRSVVRNRSLDPNEETKYCIIVGARQRFRELPDGYFGNAIVGTFVTMKAKEVMEHGIGKPAWRMNRTIATMTGESFERFLVSWPTSPNFVTLSNGDALTASSSPRFNMYGNDFGWGKPIAVRSGSSNKIDGMLTLDCGAEEGSINVEVCLFPETLEAIANDQEFMDTVTN
ncbi:hypothetical protein V6N13_085958 [Hibiscus sabdariffa]